MGASAEEPERNTSLGIFYDEILRKEVENKCGQLGAEWDYAELFSQVDEGMLRKARRFACSTSWCVCNGCLVACDREFDEAHKKVPKGSAPTKATAVAPVPAKSVMWAAQPSTPKGDKRGHGHEDAGGKKKKVTCWKCGEVGHYASKCPKLS